MRKSAKLKPAKVVFRDRVGYVNLREHEDDLDPRTGKDYLNAEPLAAIRDRMRHRPTKAECNDFQADLLRIVGR